MEYDMTNYKDKIKSTLIHKHIDKFEEWVDALVVDLESLPEEELLAIADECEMANVYNCRWLEFDSMRYIWDNAMDIHDEKAGG
jgi:hypothetical protein